MISLNQILNRAAIFLCILTYILTGNTISASYAYIVTSFHTILRISVTQYFPQGITQFAETKVSIGRIKKFLLYEEIRNDDNISVEISRKNDIENGDTLKKEKIVFGENKAKEASVCLKNVSVKWLDSLPEYNLENINFEVSFLLFFILKYTPLYVIQYNVRGSPRLFA